MKTIEQLLATGKNIFTVDTIACMQHAEVIKAYQRPTDSFAWSNQPEEVQLVFKVAFISICHQFNWDFMQSALANNLLDQKQSIPEILSTLSADKLTDWLKDYPKKERVRAKERARLLRDVGKTLSNEFNGDLKHFYNCCEKSALSDGSFQALLDKFEAYRTDSLHKKTNVLTHDLIKENILNFKDKENVLPAIDYHIMRLYLRSGRVIPADEGIFRFLEGAPNPRRALVKLLREAVTEAEQLTAFYAGLNVADVNYIEWQIGRSICINEKPLCLSPETPIEIPEDIASLCSERCPYQETCLSFNNHSEFIRFEEPQYISKDY